jgi:hypothetical protein
MSHAHRRPPLPSLQNAARACVEAGECRPAARSSKDTRRWCRGREGIPHAYLWEADPAWARFCWDRWERRIPICFGCGRKDFRWRTRCAVCGSPPRHVWTDLRGDGYRAIRSEGPFCLCPAYYHPAAALGDLWESRRDPPVAWADDPDQIRALTAAYRARAGA